MRITGSIVTFNSDLNEVLHVCKCFLNSDNVEGLYVIDNSPQDSLRAHLNFDKRIIYWHFPQNLGYGKAHNIGIRYGAQIADYHVVLNTDISFQPECIERLSAFMEDRKDVALVMPKIIFPDGSVQYLVRNNPTPSILLTRRFWSVSRKANEEIRIYQNMDLDYDRPMFNIPFLSGCFMFIRTRVLKLSGLFDEKIFMYTEDADLSRRILKVAQTAYWPEAVAIHNYKGGVRRSFRLTWYGLKSAIYYFNKWGWSNQLERTVQQKN